MASHMTAPLPVVSVCIANYNGMDVIDTCLRSVLEQDCGFAVEIIVHDDASTDRSVEHVRHNYPDAVIIESETNVGFCVANNRMAERARGEYLLLLNNDAALFRDALRTLHDHARSIGKPAILGLPQHDATTGELIDIGSTFDMFLNPIPNLDAGRNAVGMIIGACMWIPASLWRELGGFPAWFHTLAEDMYLSCVARLWGYPVIALPDSGFRHRVGHSLGGGKVAEAGKLRTSKRRRALSERNKTYVMILTYPAPMLLFLLPLHLLTLIVEGIVIAAAKTDAGLWRDIYFSCLASLVTECARLRRARRAIQTSRTATLSDFFSAFSWFPHKLRMLARHGLPEVR
jgi:GT2 family glycosyltransferase